ncbi:MAG: FAD-binding protein, partial [Odoribacter sp.]|nr:FAD-binding protein [Odoribacter sp.]
FMPAIHELAELAPRDIVAQSIYRQLIRYNQDFVWLSLKHIDTQTVRNRFPNIYEKCRELGIDMCDRIPVAPAAHYTVGGVRTDLNGQTDIPNLFICGELASSGIMGANRLASNSLIECLVFGKRAIESSRHNTPIENLPDFKVFYHCNPGRDEAYIRLKKEIASLMSIHAGIIRNKQLLEEGLQKLDRLEKQLPDDFNEYYTLISRNLIEVARLIMRSALYRKESRGGHYREDYPKADDAFLYHIVQQKGAPLQTIPINTEKN